MRTFRVALWVFLCGSFGSVDAQVGPIPGTQPIGPVFSAADIVCNCTVEHITSTDEPAVVNGAQAMRRVFDVSARVREYFKAPEGVSDLIEVEYSEIVQSGVPVNRVRSFAKNENVILFLKSKNGKYELADRFLGATSFSTIPVVSGSIGISKLEDALSRLVLNAGRDDQIKALQLLAGLDRLAGNSLENVEILAASTDPDIAMSVLNVLIKSQAEGSVERLAAYLDSYGSDYQPFALVALGSHLGQMNVPEDRPSIEKLSSSRFLSIRLGAMNALRSMRDRQSVPTLIKRLDDSDSTVQYLALITLSEITGKQDGDFAPTLYLFDKKPQFYLDLWKEWIQKEGDSLVASPSS